MATNGEVCVKVLLFAQARELSGLKEDSLKLTSQISYESLVDVIVKTYALDSLKGNIVLAHNQEYARANAVIDLKNGDEIAVIPPLSGG